jgi:hypothetical protein
MSGRSLFGVVCVGLVACEPAELELAGTYLDAFGTTHQISDAAWTQSAEGPYPFELNFEVLSYDNADQYLVAVNGPDNGYFPGLFSRFDWTGGDGAFAYCQTAYAAEDEQAALDTPRADSDDVETGCGGFSWTELSPQ